MPQAVDFLSSRIVTMEAEARLSDAAEAIRAKNATHCAVLDSAAGKFFGIVRLADAALRPSQRIAADLIAADPPPVVPETADLRQVAEQLRNARAEEAVVLSADGRFLGVITREGLLDWALREHDRAQKRLQEEIAGREQAVRDQTAHLREALKEAEHYATFASHDLRAPLRAIQSFADILVESSPSLDATGRGYLERIRTASQRMDALIEGFLEEGRAAPGRKVLHHRSRRGGRRGGGAVQAAADHRERRPGDGRQPLRSVHGRPGRGGQDRDGSPFQRDPPRSPRSRPSDRPNPAPPSGGGNLALDPGQRARHARIRFAPVRARPRPGPRERLPRPRTSHRGARRQPPRRGPRPGKLPGQGSTFTVRLPPGRGIPAMSESFRRLEQLQREMGEIALELLRGEFSHSGGSPYWRPAINAYRCRDRFTICVDLAGTTKEAIQILVDRRRLTLRGARPSLEPGGDCPGLVVLAMEIDHGPFERILDLPAEVDSSRVTAEYRNGVLWIELPLLTSG